VKKTSLYLDPDLDELLARRAEEEGLSKAEFIRRTLQAAMTRPTRPKFVGIGVIDSPSPVDYAISENVDRYLSETGFGEE
jgi:hypothetical protein